jgi:hypothetical protein
MAAGLGFKTFTSGEVLTAADTNGYLMQGVMVFASASARSAAITAPTEGQYSYLKDTNSTEYYDGSAWVAGVEGDISGVTAGVGISGGGTSGTVTVTNSMATTITTKGDLVPGTGSGTFARLAVGNNGETLVADSSTSTGLRYQATNAAGKNCIINGGMDIFQRTSFATFNAYALDRWYIGSSQNATVTQSTAKVTPNSQYMMLMTASATQQIFAYQAVETKNAIYYAGKTVTLSSYAAGLTTTTNLNMALSYSTSTDNSVSGTWTDITASSGNPDLTLSGTVTRWSATYAIPSTAKSLRVAFVNNAANITVGQGIYLGDVQLEVGSVATAFSRAGATIQGELAACQRYYERIVAQSAYGRLAGGGVAASTTQAYCFVPFKVQKRSSASSTIDTGGTIFAYDGSANPTVTSITMDNTGDWGANIALNGTGYTQFRNVQLLANNSTTAYIGFSAEL